MVFNAGRQGIGREVIPRLDGGPSLQADLERINRAVAEK
jgi:hypothetical protein